MSDLTDAEIEKQIEAELSLIDEGDLGSDTELDTCDPSDTTVVTDSDKDEDPPELHDITTAFSSYYESFESNLTTDFNEFNDMSNKCDDYLNKSLAIQGIDKDHYPTYIQELKESLSKDDPEMNDMIHRHSVMSHRSASQATERPDTISVMSEAGVSDAPDEESEFMKSVRSLKAAEVKENESIDTDVPPEPYEMKMIYAWIENDKTIERINQERWDEYSTFLAQMDVSEKANRKCWQAKLEQEIEESKLKHQLCEEEFEKEDKLMTSKRKDEEEIEQKRMEQISGEMEKERALVNQLAMEVKARKDEMERKAAVMIQKNFRGFRIRNRIGEDIEALREKARIRYRKEQIVKQEKLAQKHKAKEFAKIRQQRDLETSRSTTRQSVTTIEIGSETSKSSVSIASTKSKKSNSAKKEALKKPSVSEKHVINEKQIEHNVSQSDINSVPENEESDTVQIQEELTEAESQSSKPFENPLIINTNTEKQNAQIESELIDQSQEKISPPLEEQNIQLDSVITECATVTDNVTPPVEPTTPTPNMTSSLDMSPSQISTPRKMMYKKTAYVLPMQKGVTREEIPQQEEDTVSPDTTLKISPQLEIVDGSLITQKTEPLDQQIENSDLQEESTINVVNNVAIVHSNDTDSIKNMPKPPKSSSETKRQNTAKIKHTKSKSGKDDNKVAEMVQEKIEHKNTDSTENHLNDTNNDSVSETIVPINGDCGMNIVLPASTEKLFPILHAKDPTTSVLNGEIEASPNETNNQSENLQEHMIPLIDSSLSNSMVSTTYDKADDQSEISTNSNLQSKITEFSESKIASIDPPLSLDTDQSEISTNLNSQLKTTEFSETKFASIDPQLSLDNEQYVPETPRLLSFEPISQKLRQLRSTWQQNSKKSISDVKSKTASYTRHRRPKRSANKKLTPLSVEIISKSMPSCPPMENLSVLILHDVAGHTLTGLDNLCLALEVVVINRCGLKVLEGLDNCSQLQYLDVRNNAIDFVTLGSDSKPNLSHLDLSYNNITTVHGIECCTGLRSLSLSHNKLTKLIPDSLSSSFHSLQSLDLSHNQLVSVPAIAHCTQLQTLHIAENNISSVPELAYLKHLCRLDATSNMLTNAPVLDNNPLLQNLILNQNNLASLDNLAQYWLPNLVHLSVGSNNLIEVGDLTLPLLTNLDVSNNPLGDLTNLISNLKNFDILHSVSLDGTPCMTAQSAMATLESSLPQLMQLNGITVPNRHTNQSSANLDPFLEVCLTFGSSYNRIEKKLMDKRSNIDSTAEKDISSFARLQRRNLEELSRIVNDHLIFQESGKVSKKKKSKQGGKRPSSSTKDLLENEDKTIGRNNLPKFPDRSRCAPQLSPDEAATKIAAVYRGYKVRKVMNDAIDDLFHDSATKIQALWRGYRVRIWIRRAMEKVRMDDQTLDNDDLNGEGDTMLPIDLSQFNVDDVDRMWDDIRLPPAPYQPPARPPSGLPSKPRDVKTFGLPNPMSAWITEQPGANEIVPATPHARNRPRSSASSRAQTIFDMDTYSNGPLQKTPQLGLTPISTSRNSKKVEAIMQEWGFQNDRCASLMLERAKKLKYNSERKKKLSQMDPTTRLQLIRKFETNCPPSVRVAKQAHKIAPESSRMDYFRAKALERLQLEAQSKQEVARTYEWVFSQSAPKHLPSTGSSRRAETSTATLQLSKDKPFVLPKIPGADKTGGGWLVSQGLSADSRTRGVKKRNIRNNSIHSIHSFGD